MKTSLHHCELVVSGGRLAADAHIFSKQHRGPLKSLAGDSQICQLQQRFGIIRLGPQSLLKKLLGFLVISLPLLDIAEIEQTRSVVMILLETLLKVLPGFIEPS